MITQKEIARKDFNRVCEINDYEVFTEKQVQGYISHVKGIIQKSEVDNLSEDEVESINTFNEDLPELHKAIVLNDDLSRELVFYRERKVIFEDTIEKSEGIEKAEKTGRYANTHQNRKLGRVGQKFKERSKKAEGEEKKFDTAKEMKDAFGSLSPEQIQKKLKHYEGQVEKVKERYSGDHPKDKEYVEFAEKQLKAFKDAYVGGKKEVVEDKKEGFDSDKPDTFSNDYKKFAEDVKSDVKKNNNLAEYYLERLQKDIKQSGQRIRSIKKEAKGEDYTNAISKFEERIKDASVLSKQIKEITGEYKV